MARLARTIILGTLAASAAIWWLARSYDVESADLVSFLARSFTLVVIMIVLAAGGGAALGWLRRRFRKASDFEAFRSGVRRPPAARSHPPDQ